MVRAFACGLRFQSGLRIDKKKIQLDGKRERAATSSIKLNLADPCRTEPCHGTTIKGCQAGGLGLLLQYMQEYNAESPRQDRQRFNSHGKRNTLPIWVNNLSMGLRLNLLHTIYVPVCLFPAYPLCGLLKGRIPG